MSPILSCLFPGPGSKDLTRVRKRRTGNRGQKEGKHEPWAEAGGPATGPGTRPLRRKRGRDPERLGQRGAGCRRASGRRVGTRGAVLSRGFGAFCYSTRRTLAWSVRPMLCPPRVRVRPPPCAARHRGPLPKRRVFLVGCGRVWRAPFPGGRAPALLSAGGALAEPPLPQLGAGPAPSGARRHRPGLVGS